MACSTLVCRLMRQALTMPLQKLCNRYSARKTRQVFGFVRRAREHAPAPPGAPRTRPQGRLVADMARPVLDFRSCPARDTADVRARRHRTRSAVRRSERAARNAPGTAAAKRKMADARAAALRRLRSLRAALATSLTGDAPGALLFVCGVDGKDNWASSAVIRWLVLGESGASLIDERPRPFDGARLRKLADKGKIVDALEETALLVTRDSLRVLYDEKAYDILSPLLACGAGGVAEYVLISTDDPEARERDKVAKFELMLAATLGQERATLGVAIPSAAATAREECEYWPLVQAIAAGGEKTFLSLRHDVVDASALVRSLLVAPDADVLREALRRATPALRRHVEEAFKSGRDGLGVKSDVSEAMLLANLTEFDAYGVDALVEGGPLASLGCASLDLKGGSQQKTHVVLQAREPQTGLRVGRTYFLRAGAWCMLGEACQNDDDGAMAALATAYATLCTTFREAAGDLPKLRKAVPDGALYTSTTDCLGRVLDEPEDGSLTYVRISMKTAFGVVSVGDTFLHRGGLLTGSRCAPYFKLIGACEGPEHAAAVKLKHRLRDSFGPRSEELLLGKRLESYSHATLVLGTENYEIPHVGRLELYEDGFVLVDAGLTPLVLSFGRGDCSKLAVVKVSTEAHGVAFALTKDGASKLRAGSIRDASFAVLVVRTHAPARRAVDQSLERWRRHCQGGDARDLVKQAQAASEKCWAEEALGLSRGLSEVQDPEVEALVDAYAEKSGAVLVDQLHGGIVDQAPGKKGLPAYLLIGPPGAGVADVACAILKRGVEVDRVPWCHCEALRNKDTVDLSVEGVAHLARCAQKCQGRLLISFSVNDSSLACATACARAGIAITGVASVHSAALLAERYPDIEAGAADRNAVATTLVVQDSRAGPHINDAEKCLRDRLRAEGLHLKACRRTRFSSAAHVVDALFPSQGASLQDEAGGGLFASIERAHQFLGAGHARLVSALYAPPRTPRDFTQTYIACTTGSLDRKLLQVVLRELLPDAVFDEGVVALAAEAPGKSSRKPLRALFDIASRKVNRTRDAEKRLAELPRDVAHWKAVHAASVAAIREGVFAVDGFVELSVAGRSLARPAALDGNRRVVGATPLPETHDMCMGQRFVGVTCPRAFAANALDHLLGLAATVPRILRPRREEPSLTKEERTRICQAAADAPLPPGWQFDGSCYVDGFGRRSRLRPDAQELCQEWLKGVNSDVDAHNAAVKQRGLRQ